MEMYSFAEEFAMCHVFDLFIEELADVKLPWWYCELGSQ
jgi:hypothetical protein